MIEPIYFRAWSHGSVRRRSMRYQFRHAAIPWRHTYIALAVHCGGMTHRYVIETTNGVATVSSDRSRQWLVFFFQEERDDCQRLPEQTPNFFLTTTLIHAEKETRALRQPCTKQIRFFVESAVLAYCFRVSLSVKKSSCSSPCNILGGHQNVRRTSSKIR